MKPFKATVIDSGGGQVKLIVHQDTAEYPDYGEEVYVLSKDWMDKLFDLMEELE